MKYLNLLTPESGLKGLDTGAINRVESNLASFINEPVTGVDPTDFALALTGSASIRSVNSTHFRTVLVLRLTFRRSSARTSRRLGAWMAEWISWMTLTTRFTP